MMIGKLEQVNVLSPGKLQLAWDDGRTFVADLAELIASRAPLAPLRDAKEFGAARLSADRWSLEWPSGIDFGAAQLRRWAEGQASVLAAAK